jgi:protein tyrosine/serine phosphatase
MRKGRRLRWLMIVPAALLLAVAGYYFYVRHVLVNFHMVVRGQVYRSAQPSPEQLESWIHQYGLKTIVNLRGESYSLLPEEEAAVRRGGARLVTISMTSTRLPESPMLMRLAEEIESCEKPMLIHCQQGADRTGLASVMARMAIGGKTYERSREQMGIKFLHVDLSDEHVGAVLGEYEKYCSEQNIGTGGWTEFRYWIFNVYHST